MNKHRRTHILTPKLISIQPFIVWVDYNALKLNKCLLNPVRRKKNIIDCLKNGRKQIGNENKRRKNKTKNKSEMHLKVIILTKYA